MALIILISVLVTILILTINIVLFIVIVTFERRKRIDRLRKNISLFSPVRLANRMETYSNSVKMNNEIAEIKSKVKHLNSIEYTKIQMMLKDLNKYTLPMNFYKFIGFRRNFKNIFRIVETYEKEYLDYRFDLFDLTSDIEIEKAIVEQLKNRSNKVKESIHNSPIDQIRDSKKLNNKINRLLKNLQKLELMIDEQIKHLSDEFIEFVKKIDKSITTIVKDINFMNFNIKHIEEELQIPLTQIVQSYKNNKETLVEINEQVNEMVNKINLLKNEIRNDIPELKHKKVNENVKELDKLISELNLLIHSNIEFAQFNSEYDYISDKLMNFVRENNGLFVSEIKRHKLDDERKMLLAIENSLQNFELAYTKYEREKLSKFHKYSPQGLANLLLSVMHEYTEYINILKNNVYGISKVNESTNEINEEIALMNTSLLQIEYNITTLHGVLRDNYIKQKEEFQNKVSELRAIFKNNTNEINEKTFKFVLNLKDEISDLADQTRASAFEIFFLKESIMFLNRFSGSDDKFDEMLSSINNSYGEEKYTETLRKIKEIIEIYNVK